MSEQVTKNRLVAKIRALMERRVAVGSSCIDASGLLDQERDKRHRPGMHRALQHRRSFAVSSLDLPVERRAEQKPDDVRLPGGAELVQLVQRRRCPKRLVER